MYTIDYTIDTKTGELTLLINGVAGSGCAVIAAAHEALLGHDAVHAEETPAYYQVATETVNHVGQ